MSDAGDRAVSQMKAFGKLLADLPVDSEVQTVTALVGLYGMLAKQCILLEEIRDRLPARSAT